MRALVLFLIGCATTASEPRAQTTVSNDEGLIAAVDLNPDPNVFEMNLEARLSDVELIPGVRTRTWTYNGTVPGPLVDVKVGDTLIVHFKNLLPEPTTIHWHGIRLPNAMDGAHVTQDPVQPGATFEYRFKLRDAGLYWFHPHVRSDTQIERGLQGVLRVRGPNEPVVDRESIYVLDDVSLGSDGSMPHDLDDYAMLSEHHKVHGRVGSILLVNGRVGRPIEVRAGALHRFRFVSTAHLRYFNLTIPGHVFRVIGSDGGFFEQPYDTPVLMIGPAERYDVLLIPRGTPGSSLTITSQGFDRGEEDPQPTVPLTTLRFSSAPPLSGRVLPDRLAIASPPRIPRPAEAPFPIDFALGTVGGPEGFTLPAGHGDEHDKPKPGDPIHVINGRAGSDIPDLNIPLGAVRAFTLTNKTHQVHLFHLHGFFFQVLETDDVYDAKRNPWGMRPELIKQGHKDTISVRPGFTTTLVAHFDEPGRWMYHCHIPEHSEKGMSAVINVR